MLNYVYAILSDFMNPYVKSAEEERTFPLHGRHIFCNQKFHLILIRITMKLFFSREKTRVNYKIEFTFRKENHFSKIELFFENISNYLHVHTSFM
jgi:hypothetical protein